MIRIFPNRESALRRVKALLMEQDEAWSTSKKYFEMDEYWEWKKEEQEQQREIDEVALIMTGV